MIGHTLYTNPSSEYYDRIEDCENLFFDCIVIDYLLSYAVDVQAYWEIEPIRSKSAHPCKTQQNYTWMLNYAIYTIINICNDLLIYPWSRFRIKDTSVVNHANKTIAIPVMVKLRSSHQTAIFCPLMREYFVIIVIRKNVHVAYTKWIIITIMVYLDVK